MRVAYVVMQMPAGAEVFLSVEVRSLVEAGIEVEVFSLRDKLPDFEKLRRDHRLENVSLHYFPTVSLHSLGLMLSRLPVALSFGFEIVRRLWRKPRLLAIALAIFPKSFEIADQLRRRNFDLLYLAWGHHPAVTGCLVSRLMPSLPIVTALGAYDRLMNHPFTALLAPKAAAMVTQSQASADLIRAQYPTLKTPIYVIHRGVKGLDAVAPEQRERSHIITAARLHEWKGHQYLLQALPKIRQAVPGVRLTIYGDGDYRVELERLTAELGLVDAVRFAGHVPHDELFPELARAGVFVLASTSPADNLPNSVKEAMMVGTPVVTTPTTGIDELLEDGRNGRIIPFADVEAIVEAVTGLLSDPDAADRLAKAAREDVLARFDVTATTAQRIALFDSILSGTASAVSTDRVERTLP
jgi:colanic acid/amylovoran biosynthesis glycosyltransferase